MHELSYFQDMFDSLNTTATRGTADKPVQLGLDVPLCTSASMSPISDNAGRN